MEIMSSFGFSDNMWKKYLFLVASMNDIFNQKENDLLTLLLHQVENDHSNFIFLNGG